MACGAWVPVPSGSICLGCGALVLGMTARRCPPCQRDHAAQQVEERRAYGRRAKDTHARGRKRRKVYDDPRWREVRALVIQRDGMCRLCGATARLTVQHMNPAADDMEAALDPANLVTLCAPCHGRVDGPKAARTKAAARARARRKPRVIGRRR